MSSCCLRPVFGQAARLLGSLLSRFGGSAELADNLDTPMDLLLTP